MGFPHLHIIKAVLVVNSSFNTVHERELGGFPHIRLLVEVPIYPTDTMPSLVWIENQIFSKKQRWVTRLEADVQ